MSIFQIKPKIYKFPNGATLIYKKRSLCNATALIAGFCAGHNYVDDICGMPHFAEHLLLKGTTKRTLEDIIRDKSKITGINAFTSSHHLAVTFYESNKRINDCFEFASDILLNTKINEEILETEKNVVFEEKARKKDSFRKNIYEQHFRFMEPKFKLTEDYRMGSPEDLGKANKEDVYNFLNKHFVSDKFFLIAVSSLSFKRIKRLAKKYFINNLKKTNERSNILPYENYDLGAKQGLFIAKTEDDSIKSIVSIKFKVKNGLDYMFDYNLNCVASQMNKQSNAFYNMARKQGLVYTANACVNYNGLSSFMTFDFEFTTSKLENVDKLFNLIGDTVSLFKNNYLSEENILDYKDKGIISQDKSFPSKYMDSAERYLNEYYKYGKIITTTKKERIKHIEAVNYLDIKKNIDNVFKDNNEIYITFMGNYKKSDFKSIEEYKSMIFKK